MPGAPFNVGDVVAGRFRIERVLGAGGMGTVFAAVDGELGRRVALKVMLPEAAEEPASGERFQREAQAAVRLESVHAARVFDIGRSAGGEPFIVMEYLEGEDLEAHLKAHGPLPPKVALDHLLQACDAVGEAHRAGIVHRDIKLRNLFRTTGADGRPLIKVLDFGIAKQTTAGEPMQALTGTNLVLGTPAYSAPEQMCGSKSADARSDIWSLGVCLYELLTGHVPFEATTLPQVCAMVLTDPAPPLEKWLATAAPELERIVASCLEKDPAKRWQNIPELVAALRQAATSCTSDDEVSSSATVRSVPRPPNEDERVAAVRRCGLLDTPPEEEFTFLTEIAAALCDSPFAFITLVDEKRVWYKAWHGVASESMECARDNGYCAWAILEESLLHIPDLTRDARTASLPDTVGKPQLRMYCGAILVTPDGQHLGTLCVVDTVARELSDKQQKLLTRLAQQVMALVELRAKKTELHATLAEMKRLMSSVL